MIVKRDPDNPDGCFNCGRRIGRLETPHLWDGHVVCYECRERLEKQLPQSANTDIAKSTAAEPMHDITFNAEGVFVADKIVIGPELMLRASEISYVTSKSAFLMNGTWVEIFDLVERRTSIGFKSSDNASRFIAALRNANPSIRVPAKSKPQFFVFWRF